LQRKRTSDPTWRPETGWATLRNDEAVFPFGRADWGVKQ
jgi:hypothetical protein